MTTADGVAVYPTNYGVPTPRDILFGLGRVPRFGGHTTGPWTVLQHSLVVWATVYLLRNDGSGEAWAANALALALLHDAEEAVVGDTPSTWKTDEQRSLERELRHRILHRWRVKRVRRNAGDIVQRADHLALYAEALWHHPKPGHILAQSGLASVPQDDASLATTTAALHAVVEVPHSPDYPTTTSGAARLYVSAMATALGGMGGDPGPWLKLHEQDLPAATRRAQDFLNTISEACP